MSDLRRSLLLAAAALWAVGATPLAAQSPAAQEPAAARERALVARADSVLAWSVSRDSALLAASRTAWRARLTESQGMVLVLPGVVPADDAQRALDSARALLRDFGGIPEGFPRTVVLFNFRALDTGAVLGAPALRSRTRVLVSLTGTEGGGETVEAANVAYSVMQAYQESLDISWHIWLPIDFGLDAGHRSAMWNAYRELTESRWSVGARCVAGEAAGCRLWLGIDPDSSPYSMRFTVADLRAFLSSGSEEWVTLRSDLGSACLKRDDAACVDYARRAHRPEPIPAFDLGRRSLVLALRALHGRAAVLRALADTTGSVGDRFARAAGINEDSLVREWRYWVLTRGGKPRDRSFAAETVPVLLAAGLLLFVASRSRG
jgi:hypothetical protein